MKEVLGRRKLFGTAARGLAGATAYLLVEKFPGVNIKESQAQILGEVNVEGAWRAGTNSVIWLDRERQFSPVNEVMNKIGRISGFAPRLLWMYSDGQWNHHMATALQSSSLGDIPPTASLQVDLIGPSQKQERYPNYYRQYMSAAGITIKAKETVNPKALEKFKEIVLEMTSFRPDLRVRMVDEGAYMVISPDNQCLSSLPEFGGSPERPVSAGACNNEAAGMVVSPVGPTTAVSEANLLDYPDGHWLKNWRLTEHETAHALMFWGMTKAESAKIKPAYEKALSAGHFAKTYAMTNHYEFWAELSVVWFNKDNQNMGNPAEIWDKVPEMRELLGAVYGPSRPIAARTNR